MRGLRKRACVKCGAVFYTPRHDRRATCLACTRKHGRWEAPCLGGRECVGAACAAHEDCPTVRYRKEVAG